MSCELMDICPSASPLCRVNGVKPSGSCVGFLISAWESEKKAREDAENKKVLFVCDKRACESCLCLSEESCRHTKDVRHAKNFELFGDTFVEIDPIQQKG